MPKFILIIIGIVIVVAVWLTLRRAQGKEDLTGICATALDQTIRKSANKEKILVLLAERGEFSNADIHEALGFSERSVVRYMEELERAGKVEQIGNTGRAVTYRLRA